SFNDRGPIISNIYTLIPGALLTSIYYSEVPGADAGPRSQTTDEGPVDVHLSGSAEGIDVMLHTNESIYDGVVDNIQFTLSWKADDTEVEEMLSAYSSTYMVEQQGDPIQIGDTKYLVFASVTATNLPTVWYAGEEQTVLSFETGLGGDIAGRLWIADDSFTSQNNAMYYVSVWGTDRTGSITDPMVVSVDDPTAQVAVRTYPNPVQDGRLTIDLYTPQDQSLMINIFDASGHLVVNQPWKTQSPHAMQVLDLSHLLPGAYTLHIINERVNYHTKLILLTLN
ncbi:MAG: T9SS type A sorting domain-containing protein, partial [Bacteroidales bacterium]|nr:T9SS type A sorting domain-containing protein [Bacteroidales bacterium]